MRVETMNIVEDRLTNYDTRLHQIFQKIDSLSTRLANVEIDRSGIRAQDDKREGKRFSGTYESSD